MSLALLAGPTERFPSLVESALAVRAPEWRRRDMELELAGKLPHQHQGKRKPRLVLSVQHDVAELRERGKSGRQIATELGVSVNTVSRALAATASGCPCKSCERKSLGVKALIRGGVR